PDHHYSILRYVTKRPSKPSQAMIYLTTTPRQYLIKRNESRDLPVQFIPRRFHGHPQPVPQLKISHTLSKKLNQKQLPKEFERWLQRRENSKRQLLIFVQPIPLLQDLNCK